ncbi:response regulator [Rhodohalobacter sp. 8-1]|uniref:response regulator n=1 Tax=Rhodohalobacter sp. 8-1 TaxID=3131972 RepID=UPI0030EBCFB1
MLSEKNRRVLKTGHPVRVLIVEDSRDDADLMIRHLRKGGFKPKSHRVESAAGLISAIRKDRWDIVLCDHNMPGFDSVEALDILNDSDLNIPFLLISDALPEDIASTLLENGAKATLSKQEMGALVPAVVKELQQSISKKGEHNGKEKTKSGSNTSSISLFEAKKVPEELTNTIGKAKNGDVSSTNGHSGNGSYNHQKNPVKNILIVEDEMIQSILLEKLIKSLGYKVVGKVTTGAEAIEMALKLKPDVITMDISLQDDIDGIMATKSIQDKSMIPVIYISGNSDQYNYKRAETTNFIDFIPKPVNRESLAKSFSKAENITFDKSS